MRLSFLLVAACVIAWPAPALASAAGPFPEIGVLGPGCEPAYALPAGGVIRLTFQNVSQSCAGQRCSVIQDDPLDGATISMTHGETPLSGTFERSDERCGPRPVWVYSKPAPGEGKLLFKAPRAPAVVLVVKPRVDGVMILEYGAFGAQAPSHELLGMGWFQWERHGDSDPKNQDPIQVVVYRGGTLDAIRTVYPVDPEKKQDYRYVTVAAALEYLDTRIAEDVVPAMTRRLEATRRRIIAGFGR